MITCTHRDPDIRATRLMRLQELIDQEAFLGGSHGAVARLAVKIGTNPAYLSQILSPNIKANLGHELARRIERCLELPFGWMDVPHLSKVVAVAGVQHRIAQ